MTKPDWAERLQRTFQKRFDAGRKFERERIIELPFIHESWGGEHMEDCVTCHNIALIKGDNK